MAVTIRTIDEYYDDILNMYSSSLGVDATELGNNIKVRAKVLAAMQYQMMQYISGVQNNLYTDLSDYDQLIREGRILLGRYPSPATYGEYEVEITGEIGTVIPANTQFVFNSNDTNRRLYIIDVDYTLTSTTDTITLRALEAGTDTLLRVGDIVTSIQPLATANEECTVTGVSIEPIDAEDIENYRQDVIEAKRIIPQAGSPGDYKLWCSEITEIRTVYPYNILGSTGGIEIYIESADEPATIGGTVGVPSQATIDKVYKLDSGIETGAIVINESNGRGRKPMGVINVSAKSIVPLMVEIYLTGLSDVSLAESIHGAINDHLYYKRPFIAGADLLTDRNETITVGEISNIIYGILSTAGETVTSIEMRVSGISHIAYTLTRGNVPYMRALYNGMDQLT